jgi:hypothetical protein
MTTHRITDTLALLQSYLIDLTEFQYVRSAMDSVVVVRLAVIGVSSIIGDNRRCGVIAGVMMQ